LRLSTGEIFKSSGPGFPGSLFFVSSEERCAQSSSTSARHGYPRSADHQQARNLLRLWQPIPHRDGRIEAQVGRDGKLYNYGVTWANDAPETQATQRRKAS
jgi:hypothetical protein